jgi:hypothetical protein
MFSGWGGKKKESDKERMINELSAAFPVMRRPNSDDNVFEISFHHGSVCTLRIYVPPEFPSVCHFFQLNYFDSFLS